MTWTYNSASIGTDLAKVRLQIGDTDTNDQQLTDEEIQFFIDTEQTIFMAAYRCALALVAEYARKVDKEMGDLKLLAAQRHRHYLQLAAQLKQKNVPGIPSAGGVYISEKDTLEDNTNLVKPFFQRGMMENS
jgi:tRNA isopentenyl-2-thiomethyl-A-37 hydroxylase MiaE